MTTPQTATGRKLPPRDAPGPARWLIGALVMAAIALLAGGAWFYHAQGQQLRAAVERELEAIASLKIRELVRWRHERVTDANLVRANPYAARRALDAMAQPESRRTRAMFTGWLDPLLAREPYERALLVDAELNVRLVQPENASRRLCASLRPDVEEALRTRKVVVADWHRAEQGGAIHLSLLVPLVVRREGAVDNVPAAGLPESPADRSAGALVLEVNARDYFFPLLESWPTASRTAETLLVRRDGDCAIFLNELRHQTNTALTLRIPLNQTNEMAIQAVLGAKGVMHGVDYRGVEVVAVVKAVPDSPWFLAAKMDAEEAFAAWHFRSALILALLLASLMSAGATVLFVWQRQQKVHYQALYQVEAARQQSEEQFRFFFDQAPIGKCMTTLDGRLERANPALCRLLGYPAGELARISFASITHPDDLEESRECARSLLAGEHDAWIMEKRFIAKDGRAFWAQVNTCLARDAQGRPLHFLTHVQDITERKRAEEQLSANQVALRELTQQLQLALQVSRMGVWQSNLKPDTFKTIHGGGPISGLPEGLYPTTGETFLALVHPGDRPLVTESLLVALATGEPYQVEFRIVLPERGELWVSARGQCFRDAAGQPSIMIGVDMDITERKRAEAEMRRLLDQAETSRRSLLSLVEDQRRAEIEVRRLNDELEMRVRDRTAQLAAANRELEAFSYSVSHDLRAPLRAINGYARMLTEDCAAMLDANGRRVLGVIRAEALRMGELIDDLLKFSRLGRQTLRITMTDMTELAREVFAELRESAPGRVVDFRLAALPAAPADRSLLRQVWVNLLDNALKYTRRRDRAEIAVDGSIQGGEAVYCVKDNGAGFDMKYAGKLYGVFQRLHEAEEFEGTGVGLAMVQRLVQRHGGRVWAEAELDRGATFYFALPMANEECTIKNEK